MRNVLWTVGITSFIVMLSAGAIWGQVPPSNDKSGNGGNTAGGNCALGGPGNGIVNCGSTNTNSGTNNTAYGARALDQNTTGDSNTAVGAAALQVNLVGSFNTADGFRALQSNVDGSANTAVGFDALRANRQSGENTAVGTMALSSNGICRDVNGSVVECADTQATSNTAVGSRALFGNTSGSFNTAVGTLALGTNGPSNNNTGVGTFALFFNCDGGCEENQGSNNTAVGRSALGNNRSGFQNTAIGAHVLEADKLGEQNTAIGYMAGFLARGGLNTMVGTSALSRLDAGDLSESNNNIAVGMAAGMNLVTGNDNIYVGSPGGASNEDSTIRIGSQQKRTFIAGVNQPVDGPAAMVFINPATGQVGTQPSSARYKRDIQTMGTTTHGLLQLRPVTFSYKEDAQRERRYGLIAEEVATVYPELVLRASDGQIESVRYDQLIPMLLNELQRQERQQEELKAQNMSLLERLKRLEAASLAAAPQRR